MESPVRSRPFPRFLCRSLACAAIALTGATGTPAAGLSAAQPQDGLRPGVLLLAHGGKVDWNAEVRRVADAADQRLITEVAFGMADRTEIQSAVERLEARGATAIVAVPLFVSSNSSVIAATQYLLGLRDTAPPQLATFARMRHGSGGHHGASHGAGAAPDPARTQPVETSLPIRMTAALDRHPVVGRILVSRARSISRTPGDEAVILVAHGPVSDEANRKWLADMADLADPVRRAGFARVEYLTLRDDAPEPIWSQARAELRERVQSAAAAGLQVLIVPHLLSFGGIEEGLRKRLDGLEYRMAPQGLLPDDRLVSWVLESAGAQRATR